MPRPARKSTNCSPDNALIWRCWKTVAEALEGDDVEHPPKPVLRLHLCCSQGSGASGDPITGLWHPRVADDCCSHHGAFVRERDRQRDPAERPQALRCHFEHTDPILARLTCNFGRDLTRIVSCDFYG